MCSARQSQIHSGHQIREGCEPRPRRRKRSQYALHGFLGGLVGNHPPANAGDAGDDGLLPGSGRSPGEGNGNPLQYSRLENRMDGGACWATAQGVTEELDMP